MPTLIRLVVALVFLGGLGYAGLYALTVVVDPGEEDIVTRIPARDLAINADAGNSVSGGPPRPLTESLPTPSAAPQPAQADQPE